MFYVKFEHIASDISFKIERTLINYKWNIIKICIMILTTTDHTTTVRMITLIIYKTIGDDLSSL